jgi:hypothetical protein
MACRIGITTRPDERRKEWETRCKCFKNWQILAGPLSREEAQNRETLLALIHGCDAHHGGNEPDNIFNDQWYVYKFDHCGCS